MHVPLRKAYGINNMTDENIDNVVVSYKGFHKRNHYNLKKSHFDLKNNKNRSIDDLVEDGHKTIENIRETINTLKTIDLYNYQRDFIRICMVTLMYYIYKKVWSRKMVEIMDHFGLTKIFYEVLFVAPRRMGKTLTLAIFCMSVIINVAKNELRPFSIAVFATTKDAAKRFIDECDTHWSQLNKSGKFEYTRTAFSIVIESKNDSSDKREIIAYCGSGNVS